MGYLSEKAAYLKGLADGLEIDKSTKEGKLLSAIIETLDEMAMEVDDMVIIQEDMQEQLDDVDTALSDLEDDYYALDDDLDDLDEFDDELEDFDEEDIEDEEWEETYSFECPKCGDMIYIDLGLLDSEEEFVICPNCKERIELEFDCDCSEEDE